MKKLLAIITALSFFALTACAIPDVRCTLCLTDIYSGDAKTISDEWVCNDCYHEASRCDYCNEKHLNGERNYCHACLENGYLVSCNYCNKIMTEDEIIFEPIINGVHLWDTCENCLNEYIEKNCGTDYESTWGKLIQSNWGEPVYGTLTESQRELVNYPYLDYDCVYYVPDGYAYHSVDWCYTLENSSTIYSCTYDNAIRNGLEPCSKCVWE